MSIGTNIKSLREERKLTQEQVAESKGSILKKPDKIRRYRASQIPRTTPWTTLLPFTTY